MAAVTCTACGEPIAEAQLSCACGAPRPRRARRSAGPVAAGEVTEPRLTDDGVATTFVLGLPWGDHALEPGDEVELGREVGPWAAHLAEIGTVSRRHARVRATANGLYIQDIGSSNGVRVNGHRISPWNDHELSPGDTVELSSALPLSIGTQGAP